MRALSNRLKYGKDCPKPNEIIWVPVSRNLQAFKGLNGNRRLTGEVRGGDWHWEIISALQIPKVAECLQHWENGVPWEETGILDHLLAKIERQKQVDNCRTIWELKARYEQLDTIFSEVKRRGRLDPPNLRHWSCASLVDGILFHIDKTGAPIFGAGGCHRLAMAIALGHSVAPAIVGVVHPAGIGHLARYRRLQ
jgi:hypothetical protein